jgi:hypothetical protein
MAIRNDLHPLFSCSVSAILTFLLASACMYAISNGAPIDRDQAIEAALGYTGFGVLSDFQKTDSNITAQLISAQEANFGVLTDKSSNLVWKINFTNIVIPPDTLDKTGLGSAGRNFEVLIDAQSGNLLRIYSRLDSTNSSNSHYDSLLKDIEVKLSKSIYGFLGFPNGVPIMTFKRVLGYGIVNDLIPNEIIAYYVTFAESDGIKRDIWSIDLRGMPKQFAFEPPSSANGHRPIITHFRRIWDGKTGKLLFGSNAP